MSTPQWYLAVGSEQVGPVTEEDIVGRIKDGSADAQTLAFIAGMQTWTALSDVPKFAPHLGPIPPPPMPSTRRADVVDYRIEGEDLQFVEVELDPGEAVVAEAGALMYMTAGIRMETIFGDGSQQKSGTEMELGPGETLRVDTGCLVALQPTVNYDVPFVGGVKTAFFGGEGLFFTTLTGPGRVWLQSLPLSRLAGRIYRAAPQTGGSRKGEGSILDVVGGIGNLIDGD